MFWKHLSLACTWRTYESDTHFFNLFFSPWTGNSWMRATKYLTSVTNCWIQRKKNQHPNKIPFDILLVSQILVYIVMYYCKVGLQGLVRRGCPSQSHSLPDPVPEGSSCPWRSEILSPPYILPVSSGAKSQCWWSLLSAGSLQCIWALFVYADGCCALENKEKGKKKLRFNLSNCHNLWSCVLTILL